MRVAAYQAPLLPSGSMDTLPLIKSAIRRCESQDVEILCCPEAVLGGLADNVQQPADFAINVEDGDLDQIAEVLTSNTVTTILGFTEVVTDASFYNSAAVLHRGAVAGLYRKRYPAIRKSIYSAGSESPIFSVKGSTFGIIICNDSNHPELAGLLKAREAGILFVPTNNALPPERADVVEAARAVDVATATEHRIPVVRADVAGTNKNLASYGCSWIIDARGSVVSCARMNAEDLIVADM